MYAVYKVRYNSKYPILIFRSVVGYIKHFQQQTFWFTGNYFLLLLKIYVLMIDMNVS